MNCPVCKKILLIPSALEIGLPVSHCTECQGALVSLASYRYWRSHHADDAEPAADSALNPDSTHTLTCPKCIGLMLKYRFTPNQRKLDLCAHCDEVWLDGGEWDRLKEAHLHLRLTELFSQQWQEAFKAGHDNPDDASVWKERLGEDYEQVDKIARWISKHESGLWIRMYLSHHAKAVDEGETKA